MSELIHTNDNRAAIRWKLLTGASALALAGYLSSAAMARADGADHPIVWLEADGQFALLSDKEEAFLPPLMVASPFNGAAKFARKTPPSIWNEDAKISFEPMPDWILSLGIRYGKSSRHEAGYQQTRHYSAVKHYFSKLLYRTAFQSSSASSSEKHLILDFQAGKDFGLGMFGHEGSSLVSAGVRYAQFDSHDGLNVHSVTPAVPTSYYIFHGSFEAKRKFTGIGPSLSWDASANIAGNESDGSLTLDWGVNGAVLFGKQKVKAHYEKTAHYRPGFEKAGQGMVTVYQTSPSPSRSKNVTVPDLGGYAALSLRYTDLKISFGYRADYFFNAIDGGIDAAKKEDRSFNGPYASISIGLGG